MGKDVVRELNRLGMIVDISHVSDKTFWDTLEVSRAPMIASHSSCRALADHPRNMTDEMIKALAAKGGVVQIAYLDGFIDNDAARYYVRVWPRVSELMTRYPTGSGFDRIWEEIAKEYGPRPKASWERIIDHIDHVVKLAGIDHVGLGSDFDGGNMPEGMEDVTQLPKITEALLRRGYGDAAIKKILGENTLRVMEQVERTASN
jgi:membrane dipeptidase